MRKDIHGRDGMRPWDDGLGECIGPLFWAEALTSGLAVEVNNNSVRTD
jgi:hypothetical protein